VSAPVGWQLIVGRRTNPHLLRVRACCKRLKCALGYPLMELSKAAYPHTTDRALPCTFFVGFFAMIVD
jgi:hypothetical protein